MSTRATIHFEQTYGNPEAIVYRHFDGYPEGLGNALEEFLDESQMSDRDPMFDQPKYLAARWVAWDILRDHLTIYESTDTGIVLHDPPDIVYRYHMICRDEGQPEIVTEIYGDGDWRALK